MRCETLQRGFGLFDVLVTLGVIGTVIGSSVYAYDRLATNSQGAKIANGIIRLVSNIRQHDPYGSSLPVSTIEDAWSLGLVPREFERINIDTVFVGAPEYRVSINSDPDVGADDELLKVFPSLSEATAFKIQIDGGSGSRMARLCKAVNDSLMRYSTVFATLDKGADNEADADGLCETAGYDGESGYVFWL